ncbi:MAG: hypothetical protein K8R02_09215 [Anaerohalosphaeraceae bacterium]|nr:hypothetical protein [Anaerohalosphaeraceae bacterium]
MAIKELISKTGKWFSTKKVPNFEPLRKVPADVAGESIRPESIVPLRPNSRDKAHSLEMLQDGFEKLTEKLGGINENLSKQIEQNAELMQKIEELPRFLNNFPEALNNQKQIVEGLIEQFKIQSIKQQAFAETIEKIPQATAEQTASVKEMANQTAISAEIQGQIKESLTAFNSNVDKLKDNVEGQTDGILQMSKTFSASDRYLKYIINAQHKRFMWVFVTAIGVCTFAICVLGIVIFLLK